MSDDNNTVFVDCEAGRKLGCQTFCCRLLVKLKPHEMKERADGLPAKGYIDKNAEGLCINMDADSGLCKIWEKRPEACREYSCNDDFKLQVVLREGYTGIVDLARKATTAYIPKETYIKVPLISED